MRQVVIALGGRGSRMSPLSDFIPKPLIQIQKKPFVFYIVDQFYDRGLRKFLFLLGYELTFCEKLITDYAKKNYGAELVIDFSFSSEETETGGRVINAGSKIQFPFIFLYGDIYLPLNEIQLNQYKFSNENLVGIYSGDFRKKSRNIKVENGFLSEYSSGKSENFDAVNCGYLLIQEDLYSLINSSTSVEASILSKKNKIRIQLCLNKYYTVGDPNRISQVELFFDPRPVLLLDRDGTITLDQGPGNFLTHFDPSLVRKGVLHFFNEYSAFFRKIIIITNQPAVGNKLLGYSKMKEINQEMILFFAQHGFSIDGIFVCSHGWNEQCDCRKPKVGLFISAQHFFDVNWTNAVYVGDMERDEECAKIIGTRFVKINQEINFYDNLKDELNYIQESKTRGI